jgi:hypothetical protein
MLGAIFKLVSKRATLLQKVMAKNTILNLLRREMIVFKGFGKLFTKAILS